MKNTFLLKCYGAVIRKMLPNIVTDVFDNAVDKVLPVSHLSKRNRNTMRNLVAGVIVDTVLHLKSEPEQYYPDDDFLYEYL